MAPRVGHAALLVLAACLVAGLAWLPPESTPTREARSDRNEAQRLRAEAASVARQLTAAHEALRFLQRRDSLSRISPAPGAEVHRVAGPDVPPAWQAWITAETDTAHGRADAARAPVLAAVFVDTVSRGPETRERVWRQWRWWNSTAVAFDSAAAPYACLTIHDLRSRTRVFSLVRDEAGALTHVSDSGREGRVTLSPPDRWRSRRALGICRFFAAYGEPGRGVRAWLQVGGWQLGATHGEENPGLFEPGNVSRRNAFWFLLGEGQYALDACVHGTVDACRTWLLDPTEVSYFRSGALRLSGHWAYATGWWTTFGSLLSDLEQEMGPDRMGRFWTSSLPVDSAFTSAFGVDAGRWTYDWLAANYGPLPRQGPHSADYAISVLIAGLLVALGATRSLGRSVR